MIFALAGNQNSGKTTLFNQLTGSNQHVGNFPGVTVDQKSGTIRGFKDATVVDLPGIYSIRPYTSEEIVTRDFLLKQHPDAIINIIDATNIERNLYLTLQLAAIGIPMILALNMMDEVRANGNSIDIELLSSELGIPVVPISAAKNEGISDLITRSINVAQNRIIPTRTDFCTGAVHRCIHALAHHIEDHAQALHISPRFATIKVIEGDPDIINALKMNDNELELFEHSITEMENEVGLDRNAALADMRYTFIEQVCSQTVHKKSEHSREHIRSNKIDSLLTNKYLAIPCFIAAMLLIFYMTFGVIGTFLSDLLGLGIDAVTGVVDNLLSVYGLNPVVHSLIIDGIFTGVGSVLSFLPIIVVLFFFLSILEDSGYMARVAFVMDKLLRKIGLSGRSIVPMLMGFGCSVPAIMATRTLSSERDRKMTILLTPFMSCSAKVPIYAVFAAAFFPNHGALVMIALYLMGIAVAIVCALLLRHTRYRGNPVPFVMELPNYRMPSFKSVLLLMWDKARDFLERAFTIIFLATILIWFLQTFDVHLNVVKSSDQSLLAFIGKLLSPIFAPLGFTDWRVSTALLTGLSAKEAVVSTLSVLTGTSMAQLGTSLAGIFTPLTAFTFLVFTLLYTPCFAAIATVRQEMKSRLSAVYVLLFQTGVAWAIAFMVYRIGLLFIH